MNRTRIESGGEKEGTDAASNVNKACTHGQGYCFFCVSQVPLSTSLFTARETNTQRAELTCAGIDKFSQSLF